LNSFIRVHAIRVSWNNMA